MYLDTEPSIPLKIKNLNQPFQQSAEFGRTYRTIFLLTKIILSAPFYAFKSTKICNHSLKNIILHALTVSDDS